jgi:hypothetical protein
MRTAGARDEDGKENGEAHAGLSCTPSANASTGYACGCTIDARWMADLASQIDQTSRSTYRSSASGPKRHDAQSYGILRRE